MQGFIEKIIKIPNKEYRWYFIKTDEVYEHLNDEKYITRIKYNYKFKVGDKNLNT